MLKYYCIKVNANNENYGGFIMNQYSVTDWSIKQVAEAFREKNIESQNKRVIIPIFQRGLRWSKDKRREFIDSLKQGFPFGSLLFSRYQNNSNLYSVVDGLQRGSTACDYVFNPFNENNLDDIDEDILNRIRLTLFPGNTATRINKNIQECVFSYLKSKNGFNDIDCADIADNILDEFKSEQESRNCSKIIREEIKKHVNALKEEYDKICESKVPIVIYEGPQENLNEIFKRINKQGEPLSQYDIFAATWSQEKKVINEKKIVQNVVNKYLALTEKYSIEDFDSNEMNSKKELTAFEYLFGLGKYWYEKFGCLKIEKPKEDDVVNEISFEIVNACINKTNKISNLDTMLFKLNINKLQNKIEDAINYVSDAISVISEFKGNKRGDKVLHSKYQIISLISYTFREMYDINDLSQKRSSWNNISKDFSKRLREHYVADIISDEWHDGGGSKVYIAMNNKKYHEHISKQRWESILDNYYQGQLSNKQSKKFSTPTNTDSVILNCIYVNLFTANDQLSSDKKFDIEHLATKEKMKKLLSKFDDFGLPVSCIGNLCYLPEDINRGKKDKTIYEAKDLSLSIEEIESKYSFTTKKDFDWLDDSLYNKDDANDARILKDYFMEFLDKRYNIIKEKFLNYFGY